MKKKYSNLFKNLGLFTIGSFGSKLIAFLLLPLYTYLLSTTDYGMVDLLQSTALLLTPILLLSIQDATLRFGMDPEYKKEDVLSTSINIIIKGTLILLIGIVFSYVFGIFKISFIYWIFLFFIFFFGALNNCFTLYLKSKDKATVIAVGGIIGTLITCVSNILFLVIFKFGINGYMFSNIIGILSQLVYQFIIGKIYQDFHIRKYNNISKPMIKYSAPLIANSISWWVNTSIDRYIITWMLDVTVNGIYAVAYKIPSILATFQATFYNAWSISAISEFDKNDNDGFIGQNYVLYSFVSIVICSGILLLNIPIASILYSKDYFIAWKCVPFLLVSTVFNGIAQFEGSLFAAVKKTKQVSITTIVGAIINIIFNIILIYKFGIVGAAFSTLLGYGFTWLLRTVILRKFIRMRVNWKLHLTLITILIIQSILATLNILWSVQMLLFAIIICLNFRYIKKLISLFFKNKITLKSD